MLVDWIWFEVHPCRKKSTAMIWWKISFSRRLLPRRRRHWFGARTVAATDWTSVMAVGTKGGAWDGRHMGSVGPPPDFLKKYVFRSKSFSFKRLPHQKFWSSYGPIEHQSCQIAIWAHRCIEKPQHFPKFSFFWLWFCLRMNEICNSFNGGT